MTFSISARCERTGMFGIAVTSSSLCVAARCAHARAGVGVCASQNITDPRLGTRGLDLMASGLSAIDALVALREAEHVEYRQLGLVDAQGRTAHFSGTKALGIFAGAETRNAVALGNLLATDDIPARMTEAFEQSAGAPLGDRLIGALKAGLAAGGEAGPVHSAGMILVDRVPWPVTDLRVDRHDDPIGALASFWKDWQPQMEDYVARALDPAAAPRFGVPGDL